MDGRKRQTYGNGKCYFYINSYGILADERNSYVLLKQSLEIRLRKRNAGSQDLTVMSDVVMSCNNLIPLVGGLSRNRQKLKHTCKCMHGNSASHS